MENTQQSISDTQAVQVINKLRTKGSAVSITIDEIVGEFQQLFIAVVNQKNKEITAKDKEIADLKEEAAKTKVQEKYVEKALPTALEAASKKE